MRVIMSIGQEENFSAIDSKGEFSLGFFETLGQFIENAHDDFERKRERMHNEFRELREEYKDYDDEKLVRIYKRKDSELKKKAAVSVLQERYNGYSDGELKEIFRSCSDERRNLAGNILRRRGYGR